MAKPEEKKPKQSLREGYPAGARYDFAWPFDYPYGPPPRYAESDGTPFTDEERAMPIDELRRKIAEPQE